MTDTSNSNNPDSISPSPSSNQEKKEQKFVPVTFAQMRKLIVNDLNTMSDNWGDNNLLFHKYSKEQVISFLEQPIKYEKQIRNLVRFLYGNSPHFRQLILYFANLLRFNYIIEPYGIDPSQVKITTFQSQYQEVLDYMDNMNLQHELVKIMRMVMREDIVYGYELSTSDSYYIMTFDPNLCAVSSFEDGVRNYSFDFSFFDGHTKYLSRYPEEFQQKYKLYQKDRTGNRWQELDSRKTICLKFNEDIDYVIPPFAAIIESIFDLNENREREKLKHKMDNYMVLVQKIPMKQDEVNGLLVDMDTATAFHNRATESLPDEVGMITSPMDIDAIKLNRSGTDPDNPQQAEQSFYSDAGISQFLFSTSAVSASGLAASLKVDEQNMFSLLRQIERWVNRKLKRLNGKYKFRAKFLDITNQNYKDVQDNLLSAAQSGLPVKMQLCASYGLSPSSVQNMVFLENDVLNLVDKFTPLSTSFTQSSKSQGRPSSNEEDLSDSGSKTRETDENAER